MRPTRFQQDDGNSRKEAKLRGIVEALLAEMLVNGFSGAGTVRITVQDGTIQVIEERVERKHS